MSIYEITFIARQEITEKDVEAITKNFTDYISKNGGKELKGEYWGLREFAYEIRKAKRGHYQHIVVESPAEAVIEVERQMKLHEDILRCLIIKAEEFEKEPSALLNDNDNNNYKEAKEA